VRGCSPPTDTSASSEHTLLGTDRFWAERADVRERLHELLRILDLDAQVVLVARVLLREVARLREKARLGAHADRGVEVERQLASAVARARALGADERLEAANVLELCVRVEQERRVVRVREPERVQLLQVRDEVADPLRVEELPRPSVSACYIRQNEGTLRMT
jgi:hypothetical protein